MVTPARSLIALSTAAVAVDRAAEIALQHLPEPLAVLDDEGIVQVIALAESGERLGVRRPRAEQRPHRVAGREMDQREDAEGDDEEERHGDGQPPEDEANEIRAAHRSDSEIAVEPGDGSPRRRPAGGRVPGSHGLRADRRPAPPSTPRSRKRGIELLRLAERRAAVLAAMEDQGRRRRLVEPHERRAVERDVAVALLGQRPAVDEAVKIVVAGIVAARAGWRCRRP